MDPLFPVEDRICREADGGNDELAGLLFTDELTGLQNRRSFRCHIERFREQADRKNDCFSLLYIYVDQFRSLNEKYGLGAAESTLIKVAKLLSHEFSDCGVVFRYAGDEFLALLPRISESQVLIKAKQLQEKVGSFFEVGGTIGVSVSIVVAVYPDHASSVPSILQWLDRALKSCKTNGTNQILSVSAVQSSSHERSQTSHRIWCSTLVGRMNEWNRLQELFDQCQQGSGRFVFVTGEAGIGKSHLLQSFLRGRRQGNCFVFNNAIDGMKHLPNGVLRSALKNGIEENSFVCNLLPTLPEKDRDFFNALLPSMLPEHSTKSSHGDGDEGLCRAVDTLIRTVTRLSPMVLALDDIQPHDALVLSLLQVLSRECRDVRLMVIAVVRRDLEMSPILNWFVQSMTRSGLFEEVNLNALSPEECGLVVSNIFARTPVNETFRDWVYKETMGNPFYIEELIQLAVEEGLIVLSDGAVDIRKTDRILIPDSVRDPILRRIKNLSEVNQYILGLASVVGYEFDFQFVSTLLSETHNYREEMIEELIQLQFFHKTDKGMLRFFSRRVRDLIYEEMGKFNRRMFHEQVAEQLEKGNQTDRMNWPELAYHYARTGNLAKTIHYMCESERPILEIVRRETE